MKITFRDELGHICVEVDEHGIDFVCGTCFFSDGEKDYTVDAKEILLIRE